MIPIPSPLHPAVVHFPIVLLVIGAGVAVVSILVNRWHLTWISASLLVMGAMGAFVAVETGEAAQEIVGKIGAEAEQLLESHQAWAERTEIVAIIAAVLAVLTAAFGEFATRRMSFVVHTRMFYAARAITAAAALLSSFFVYQTSRRGGEMVYEHGIGVNTEAGQVASPTLAPHRE